MKTYTDIKLEHITAICDAREKLPCDLSPIKTVRGTLTTGDYSVQGLQHCVAVERKSKNDLVMCCGAERERFEREIQRLLAYPFRLLVVEAPYSDIEMGGWRGKLQPSHVIGSLISWQARGIPVMCVSDHAWAGRYIAKFLFTAARHRWRELQSLHQGLKIVEDAS